MKVNKTQALLNIFYLLLKHKEITKEEIKSMIDISDVTFRRYMQEIRAFFFNFDIDLGIKYDRREDKYLLISDKYI